MANDKLKSNKSVEAFCYLDWVKVSNIFNTSKIILQ